METTTKEFKNLIDKHTKELLKGLTIQQIIKMDHYQLNQEAIKLAQKELKAKDNQ